jgi:curli biogenesis system outer membrane secretion channel CsgG
VLLTDPAPQGRFPLAEEVAMRSVFLMVFVLAGCASSQPAPAPSSAPTAAPTGLPVQAGVAATPPAVQPRAGAPSGQLQPDTRPGLAVFPFTAGALLTGPAVDTATTNALAVGLQQMLLTELSQNSNLRVVERSLLREVLEEQNLGASGRVDAQTAARIGRLVGARYAVAGAFMEAGAFRMDARIIDVETGEILRAQEVRGRRNDVYELLVDLAARITRDVNLPALPDATMRERRAREIPAEAVTLYSRAQVYEDHGQTERAIELYRRIGREFPQMVEAREALDQLTQG